MDEQVKHHREYLENYDSISLAVLRHFNYTEMFYGSHGVFCESVARLVRSLKHLLINPKEMVYFQGLPGDGPTEYYLHKIWDSIYNMFCQK